MRPLNLRLERFLEVLMELAPEVTVQGRSIESFVYAPTYKLEVFGRASGDEVGIKGTEECFYEPGYDIAPLSILEVRDSWTLIPKTKAGELELVREEQELNPLKSLQGKVQTTEGRKTFFKPRERGREKEFPREVEMLLRIKEAGLAGSVHRLPVLESLVVAGENQDQVIVGFLVNFIVSPSLGSHLLSPGIKSQITLHQKWRNQVRETVKTLHEYDIVWSDVNPCNVVIDEKMDAWVIDFGGRNNAEFVDDDKAETKEGDWQGVQRLFGEWLSGGGDLEIQFEIHGFHKGNLHK